MKAYAIQCSKCLRCLGVSWGKIKCQVKCFDCAKEKDVNSTKSEQSKLMKIDKDIFQAIGYVSMMEDHKSLKLMMERIEEVLSGDVQDTKNQYTDDDYNKDVDYMAKETREEFHQRHKDVQDTKGETNVQDEVTRKTIITPMEHPDSDLTQDELIKKIEKRFTMGSFSWDRDKHTLLEFIENFPEDRQDVPESKISNLTSEQIKELGNFSCPEAVGFEGPETYPDCTTCLICLSKEFLQQDKGDKQ